MLQMGKKYRVVMADSECSWFEGYVLMMDNWFITLTRDKEPTIMISLSHVRYIVCLEDVEFCKGLEPKE